jgi:hypothetical protein
MKRRTLLLLLSLVVLTVIAFSGWTILTDDTLDRLSAADATQTTAPPVWILVTQDEAPVAVNSPETNWSRLELSQHRSGLDYRLSDQPRQFYLAGVLIDGQKHLVDLTGSPHENIQVNYVELSQTQPLGSQPAIN